MRSNVIPFVPLLGLGFASLLSAQESGATAPATIAPATRVAPFVLRTSQSEVAEGFGSDHGLELPEIGPGEHYVLTMKSTGEMEAGKGKGAVSFLEIDAQPKVLMDIFADQVEQGRNMAKMVAGMAAGQAQMKPADVNKIVDALFDFPKQVETVTLRVEGDEQKGFDAHAEFLPVAKSDFEGVVQTAEPSGKGVPNLGDGVVSMGLDLAPKALNGLFEACMGLIVSRLEAGERDAAVKLMHEQLGIVDGSMALVLNKDVSRMVLGCTDSAAMRKMMASGDWQSVQKAIMASMPEADVKLEATKLGDLDVLHSVGELGVDNPMFKDGKFDSWSTVAGDMLVAVVNGGKKPFEEMVAQASAGTLKRAPLPRGAFMTVSMRIADLAAMSGEEVEDGMPQSVSLSLGKKGKTMMALDVQIRK